jgi:hypothetical protein
VVFNYKYAALTALPTFVLLRRFPPARLLKIAQPFMAGFTVAKPHQSRQGRQKRSFVPDGTVYHHPRSPSLKRLGYFQNHQK